MTDFRPPLFIVVRACAGLAMACLVTSCGFMCNQAGCDAASRPGRTSSITTGIVGIAAAQADIVSPGGCVTCGFAQATLEIWRTPTAIINESAAQELVAAKPPEISVDIDQRYEQALAAGDYLICHGGRCAPLALGANEVFTVNVVVGLETDFHVWAPKAGQEMSPSQFFVGWP